MTETVERTGEAGGGDAPDTLERVLDDLLRSGDGERVSVGDILSAFGGRALGPLLFIPAVVAIAPIIGMLPGVSWTMAALILLGSAQHLAPIGTRHCVWAPAGVRRVSFACDAFAKGAAAVRPWLRRLDGVTHRRLAALIGPGGAYAAAAASFALAIGMFALSIVPGGVVLPAIGVALFGIGLTTRDGLFAALGYGFLALTTWALWRWGPKTIDAVRGLF